MNRTLLYFAVLLVSVSAFAQKKEKLKGSKIVTIEQKTVDSFTAIELHDDIEVSLIKGDKNGVELEADDNLQSALSLVMNGSTLLISTAQEFTGHKKFAIRVTYTSDFKSAVAMGRSKITALEKINLEDITFRAYDEAKLFLNIESKSFHVHLDDKAKAELNAKAESAQLELSKNSEVKALIAATTLKCDLYQKSVANIEGDVTDMKLRVDNNSLYVGKKLTAKNVELVAEGFTTVSVIAESTISIEASGNTEVHLYGEPKTELRKFSDSAVLMKKTAKQ